MARHLNRRSLIVLSIAAAAVLTGAGGAGAAITTTDNVTPDPKTTTSSTDLYIGDNADGTMSVDGGSTVSSANGYLGYGSGVKGQATIDGTNSTWNLSRSTLMFGSGGGAGTLDILNGGQVSDDSANLRDGQATVSGADSTWANTTSLDIGLSGSATVKVADGGQLNDENGFLDGGQVSVDGAGSTWTNTSQLWVGAFGAKNNATVNISNGALVNTASRTFVETSSTGQGIIHFDNGTLDTGTLLTNTNWLTGTGTVNTHGLIADQNLVFDQTHGMQQQFVYNSQSGQDVTVNLKVDGTGELGAGYDGTGSLTIRDGRSVTSSYGYLGWYSGSVGTANIDGPDTTWNVNNPGGVRLIVGRNGKGVLNIINGAQVNAPGGTRIGSPSGGSVIHFDDGTLTTSALFGDMNQLTGTGVVNTNGMISNLDLVFDKNHSLQQQFTHSSQPGQVVTVNLNVNGFSRLGAGYFGQGSLTIRDGMAVRSTTGDVGYGSGAQGTATVAGAGSVWTSDSTLNVGENGGSGILKISAGGTVNDQTGRIGGVADSSVGQVMVDGSGSHWSNQQSLHIQEGVLTISNGGQVTDGRAILGGYRDLAASVTVEDAGSTWRTTTGSPVLCRVVVGSYADAAVTITNGGLAEIAGPLYLGVAGGSGTVNLDGGTLDMQGHAITPGTGTATFNFTAGTLENVSTFDMNLLEQGGTLSAGDAPGSTNIQGNYTLDGPGTLLVELAGSGGVAGTDFDFYHVTGTATLQGLLRVLTNSDFTPQGGETFNVLTASSIDASGLSISSGYNFSILSGDNGQILQITSVPEPGTLALLILGGLGLLLRRRVQGRIQFRAQQVYT